MDRAVFLGEDDHKLSNFKPTNFQIFFIWPYPGCEFKGIPFFRESQI